MNPVFKNEQNAESVYSEILSISKADRSRRIK